MTGQLLKSLISLMITLLCLGSLLTIIIWCMLDNNNVETLQPPPRKERPFHRSDLCEGCSEVMDKVVMHYAQTWKKNEDNYQQFRSQLKSKCNGAEKAIVTQANTPVGSKLVYDGEKSRTLQVNQELFRTFIKEHPLANKTWDTCSVVGNGGILVNSSCGNEIDSAQLVFRCNLALTNGYEKDVGVKTDLTTANPSIFRREFGALMGDHRPFVESLHSYGNSLLLLPAFSYGSNTPVSLRAVHTIEDFGSPIRPIFFNPEYLQNLAVFWRTQGIKEARLSTGLMLVSMALEHCTNVHLYGFWPFSNHPHDFRVLRNHYYDNIVGGKKHTMPTEFKFLLGLHSQGVLRLHLGDCPPG